MAVDRINRDELRELLVTTGVQVLLDQGMTCGLDHVTFPTVFERVERDVGRRITRASVYDRLWDNQEQFQWDVLVRLIEDSTSIDQRTRRRVRRILTAADISSPDGRLAGLHELCLLAVKEHVTESAERQNYRIIMAAFGAIASAQHVSAQQGGAMPEGASKVADALRAYIEGETELYIELYGIIGLHLGFRLREPLELRQFVLAIGALADGIAMRLNFFPEYGTPIDVPQQDGQPPTKSSLAGWGVEAIALTMLELDPDWVPPT